MKNLMIDIETLGKSIESPIIAIAAVEFDFDGKLGKEFDEIINAADSVEYSRLEIDTVIWWLNQPKEAQEIFSFENQKKAKTLYDAFSEFENFLYLSEIKEKNIWTKGNFDLPILENLFCIFDKKVPWKYHQACDVRTVLKLSGLKFEKQNTHNALDDCKNQIDQLIKAINHL